MRKEYTLNDMMFKGYINLLREAEESNNMEVLLIFGPDKKSKDECFKYLSKYGKYVLTNYVNDRVNPINYGIVVRIKTKDEQVSILRDLLADISKTFSKDIYDELKNSFETHISEIRPGE